MSRSIRAALLALSAFFILSHPASAGIVSWTLNDVEFNVFGVGGITGSFDYDADTATYSAINLTATLWGTNSPGFCGSFCAPYELQDISGIGDVTGTLGMELNFASPLTDAGGTVGVTFAAAGLCSSADCSGLTGGPFSFALGTSGTVSSTSPEPGSLFLCISSMILLCALGIRRRLTFHANMPQSLPRCGATSGGIFG